EGRRSGASSSSAGDGATVVLPKYPCVYNGCTTVVQGMYKGCTRDQQARNTAATPEQRRSNTLASGLPHAIPSMQSGQCLYRRDVKAPTGGGRSVRNW